MPFRTAGIRETGSVRRFTPGSAVGSLSSRRGLEIPFDALKPRTALPTQPCSSTMSKMVMFMVL